MESIEKKRMAVHDSHLGQSPSKTKRVKSGSKRGWTCGKHKNVGSPKGLEGGRIGKKKTEGENGGQKKCGVKGEQSKPGASVAWPFWEGW